VYAKWGAGNPGTPPHNWPCWAWPNLGFRLEWKWKWQWSVCDTWLSKAVLRDIISNAVLPQYRVRPCLPGVLPAIPMCVPRGVWFMTMTELMMPHSLDARRAPKARTHPMAHRETYLLIYLYRYIHNIMFCGGFLFVFFPAPRKSSQISKRQRLWRSWPTLKIALNNHKSRFDLKTSTLSSIWHQKSFPLSQHVV